MGEAIQKAEQQQEMTWNSDQINTIKNQVAKGATDTELKLFLYQARSYGLDPLRKELIFWKTKQGDVTIMTTRDGYLKIAQTHPEYDGILSFVVKEGDTFEIDAANYAVVHKFGAKRGVILGAWARCDRRDRKPSICYVEFAEYNTSEKAWKQYPSAMIQKVAEAFVLKRMFALSGLVTQEEIGTPEASENFKVVPPAPEPEPAPEVNGNGSTGPDPSPADPQDIAFIRLCQRLKEQAGEEAYYEVLGSIGFEHCNQIQDDVKKLEFKMALSEVISDAKKDAKKEAKA